MNNYKLINEQWQRYVKSDNLEEQFNRELNKLLKELQILREANEPGMMGKIAQKVGTFLKSAFGKIASAIKSAPKMAISLVTKLVNAAGKFLKDPETKARLLTVIKTIGILAVVAAALYSPEARAAIVDPDTGHVIGAGGNEAAANAYVGALASISDILEKMVSTDIDIKAAALKDPVLQLISKINKPEVVQLTGIEKDILKIAKTGLRVIMDTDKHFGTTDLTETMMDYGKKFHDFIITKIEGNTTHFKGTLPGSGKGVPRDVADIAQSVLKPGVQKLMGTIKR